MYFVEINVKNEGENNIGTDSSDFRLMDSDNIGICIGESATWTIYFDVHEDKTPTKILYKYSVYEGDGVEASL